MEFDVDAEETILSRLAEYPAGKQLRQAAKMAGRQLELLKPAVMGQSAIEPNRMYIGPAAQVPNGFTLVVLANAKKVVTVYVKLTENAAADFGDSPARPSEYLVALDEVIRKFGAQPGQRAPDVPQDTVARVLDMLFAVLPPEQRQKVLQAAVAIAADGICLALVFLIGPASSGTRGLFSLAWPVCIPLAPYIDRCLAAA